MKNNLNLKFHFKGICGKTTAALVGGVDNMFPLPKFDKLYDVKTIGKRLGFNDKTFVFGASFGPWPLVKTKSKVTECLNLQVFLIKNKNKNFLILKKI